MNALTKNITFPTTGVYSATPATTGVGINFSTSAIDIEYYRGYSFQTIYSGGTKGTASILASNDGTNFSTVSGTSQVLTGAGNFIWNVDGAYYRYVQFNWGTTGAGPASTGTMTVIFSSKSF